MPLGLSVRLLNPFVFIIGSESIVACCMVITLSAHPGCSIAWRYKKYTNDKVKKEVDLGKTGDWIKDENGYIRYVHYKDVLTLDDYEGIDRITYHFQGKEYILCSFEYGLDLTPEEYSNICADGDWCSLGVIDLKSKPILPNIYPYDMLTFVWDENHEYMYPTELEHVCFYDLKTTDICHIDLKSLDEYSNDNFHILLLTKFIKK